MGFPDSSEGKESACNAGDTGGTGSTPGLEAALEKGMATQASILAWRIPWTEEPGGLESMGSQRVRCDLLTLQQQQISHCTYAPQLPYPF